MPTVQPSSASRRAIAAPMPFAPPVTMTPRSFKPRIAPSLMPAARRRLRAARQHAGRFVDHDGFAVLVLHLNARCHDAAVALGGRPHRRHLDLAMHGVADAHRRQHLLLQFQHRQPGALDHALAEQSLDQTVSESGGDKLSLDRTLVGAERAVGEDRLHHAGDADEHHQVGLGQRAVERAEALTGRQLLPGEAEAKRLHEVTPRKMVQRTNTSAVDVWMSLAVATDCFQPHLRRNNRWPPCVANCLPVARSPRFAVQGDAHDKQQYEYDAEGLRHLATFVPAQAADQHLPDRRHEADQQDWIRRLRRNDGVCDTRSCGCSLGASFRCCS